VSDSVKQSRIRLYNGAGYENLLFYRERSGVYNEKSCRELVVLQEEQAKVGKWLVPVDNPQKLIEPI
jgi:hypothetical protein